MNYRNYQLEDFLADEEFKHWVLTPNPERNEFWKSWLKANPEKTKIVLEAREIILSIKYRHIEPSAERYETSLSNILNTNETRRIGVKQHKHGSLVDHVGKVAAVILILICFGLSIWLVNSQEVEKETYKVNYITKENPKGQKSTFSLPDGTVVTLNAESKIKFPTQFHDSVRFVELSGEAFFDVYHDTTKAFVVASGDLLIKALGTSFNIRFYREESQISVALATGIVEVSSGNHNKMKLVPGEQLTYHIPTKEKIKVRFNPRKTIGWKDGILIFNDIDLDEFVGILERWYGVKFKLIGEKQKVWHIEGEFENESLREILDGLSFTYNVDYEIDENIVTLKL